MTDERRRKDRRDARLDEALDGTFPASDPVTAPATRHAPAEIADAAVRAWAAGAASGDFAAFLALLAPELESQVRPALGARAASTGAAPLGDLRLLAGSDGWFVVLREGAGSDRALALRVIEGQVVEFREYVAAEVPAAPDDPTTTPVAPRRSHPTDH